MNSCFYLPPVLHQQQPPPVFPLREAIYSQHRTAPSVFPRPAHLPCRRALRNNHTHKTTRARARAHRGRRLASLGCFYWEGTEVREHFGAAPLFHDTTPLPGRSVRRFNGVPRIFFPSSPFSGQPLYESLRFPLKPLIRSGGDGDSCRNWRRNGYKIQDLLWFVFDKDFLIAALRDTERKREAEREREDLAMSAACPVPAVSPLRL